VSALRPTRVSPVAERLADGRRWLRVADPDWSDPLDPTFAGRSGGRWNPPGSFPVLYLNEDVRTARANLAAFVAGWPYELEDLRADRAPCLAVARLPRSQFVADAHSPAGLRALGLPRTYPLDATGALVPKERCQPLGSAVEAAGLRGVHCRSARLVDGSGRELAWFPASARSHAALVEVLPFREWYRSGTLDDGDGHGRGGGSARAEERA
jgi:hypothetical protein